MNMLVCIIDIPNIVTDIVFYFIYKLLKFIDKSGKSCKKYPVK